MCTTNALQACLINYNFSPEAVIDNVLQESLPPRLKDLDQSLDVLPTGWQGSSGIETLTGQREEDLGLFPGEAASGGGSSGLEKQESLLEQRSSIFDNDEFDVFRRKDVDRSRVHIGKK